MRITQDKFDRIVDACGYDEPPYAVFKYFKEATGNNFGVKELSLLLAELIHESGGFRYIEESDESIGNNTYDDGYGYGNKSYHGRGYIQLTYAWNYKQASRDLDLDVDIWRNPDVVASNRRIAMEVSIWYWKKFVRPRLQEEGYDIDVANKAINPREYVEGRYDQINSRKQKFKRAYRILSEPKEEEEENNESSFCILL